MKRIVLTAALLCCAPAGVSAQSSFSGTGNYTTWTVHAAYALPYRLVTEFGALGNGVADDTAAIQAALDAVTTTHGELYFPPGTYKITSSLVLTQKSNFAVRGPTKQAGTYSTSIKWAGAAGGTMLLLDGVRDSEWSDLAFDGGAGATEPAVIIDIDKIAAGGTIARKNGFHRMLLRGGTTSTVRIANTSTTNNEAHVFEDVDVSSIALGVGYGYQVKNINAKNIQVVRGGIGGKTTAVRVEAGSIHLHSVEISSSTTWLSVAGGGETTVIENCDGDSSRTFLELRPASTNPVYATGNRFIQATDGDLFTFNNNSGPVVLIANDFSSGGYRAGATTTLTSNGPRMVAIGNVFPNATVLPYPVPPAVRFAGLYAVGNQYFAAGNTLTTMDDALVPHRAAGGSYSTLRFGGATGFVADTYVVPSVTGQFVATSSVITFSASGNYTLTSTPTIAAGTFDGQTVTLLNTGSNSVTLQDRGTLTGSGVALTASTVTVGPRQSIVLTWLASQSLWIQTGPLVSPL